MATKEEWSDTVGRFLGRYPSLRPQVGQVLERAAAVRGARLDAFGSVVATPLSAVPTDALDAAIARFEQTASDRSSSFEVLADAARTVASKVLTVRVSSHAARPTRATSSLAARQAPVSALLLFWQAYAELETAARAAYVRQLPWPIEASPLADPCAPADRLTIAGNCSASVETGVPRPRGV